MLTNKQEYHFLSVRTYSKAETEAVLSALVELGQELQPYRDYIILRGGLAEYLLTKGFFDYCGAKDIDFAVKKGIPNKGKTIYEIVTGLGYELIPYPASMQRAFRRAEEEYGVRLPSNLGIISKPVISPIDDKEYTVRIDFASHTDVKEIGFHNLRDAMLDFQEEDNVGPLYGLDLDFVFNFELEIVSNNQKTNLKVVDLVGAIVSKMEMDLKNYYDIFALTHCDGGPLQAAEAFKESVASKKISKKHQRMLKEFIQELSENFRAGSVGAWAVEEFDEKQKEDVVVKHMNQFIEPVSQFLESF